MRRWLLRFGLVVGGAVLAVFAAEGVARLVRPRADAELLFSAPDLMPDGVYTPDPELFLVPTPGFVGRVESVGYGVTLRFDAHGLRGDGGGAAPRWVAVGDSFTLAAQVAEEDTFEAKLGRAVGVTVLNAGVDGYSTWQETRRYARVADAVDVDGVLVTFFLGNDLGDDARWEKTPPGAAHPPPHVGAPPVEDFLARHSYLWAFWRVGRARAAMEAGTDPSAQRFRNELRLFTKSGAGELQNELASATRALAALRDEAARRGDGVLVAVAPPAFALTDAAAAETLATFGLTDPSPDAPRQAVLGALRELALPACDLQPALAASPATPYFQYDGHWNPTGHAVVAEAIRACWPR